MSIFNKIGTYAVDSPSIDAFGRWRVSNPQTLFDSKLLTTGSIEENWSERIWAQGTSSFNTYESYIHMAVGITSGSRSINQTKKNFVYEPGKSLLVVMTGQMQSPVDGVEKYMIYGNDHYGLGFCYSGSSFGVVKRNTTSNGTTTTFISQSNWNLDKYDGHGASERRYDPNYCQIHFLDMEWLGVGRVRLGVFQGGEATYVHEFGHVNELTSTYMSNPNLPVRFEIVNKVGSSTTSSMKHICCSVISEGGTENLGIVRSIDNGSTPISVGAGTHVGLLYARHITGSTIDGFKADSPRVSPSTVSIFPFGNQNVRWTLQLNPIVANSNILKYNRLNQSSIEYATGSSTTTITTPGKILSSGYVPGGTNQAGSNNVASTIDPFFALGKDLYGNRDTLVVTVQEIEGGGAAVSYGQLSLKEVI